MSLDAALWDGLTAQGVTETHLRQLLGFLRTETNGCVCWHFVQGHVLRTDVRFVFASQGKAALRVSEALLEEGNGLAR